MFTCLLKPWQQLRAALPSSCYVCRSFSHQSVCSNCLYRFAQPRPRCTGCAFTLPLAPGLTPHNSNTPSQMQMRCGTCLTLGSSLDATYAAVDYQYPWDRLIQRFKYSDSGDLRAEPALAQILALVMQYSASQDSALSQALDQAAQSDWIIPIALHPERQRERGFNQSHELAQALWPSHPRIRHDLLLRIKSTATQTSLERDEREGNLRHAFIAAPLHASLIKGRKITLIDDVRTTGSTLTAAAQALRQAGAAQVNALVFARTT